MRWQIYDSHASQVMDLDVLSLLDFFFGYPHPLHHQYTHSYHNIRLFFLIMNQSCFARFKTQNFDFFNILLKIVKYASENSTFCNCSTHQKPILGGFFSVFLNFILQK